MATLRQSEPVDSNTTKSEWDDLVYTGPGTLAGRYMRLFWHPVYIAEDLPVGRAKPIRVMSQDATLYRGESGKAHVVAFRCAHRGTQLTTGWIEGDDIRCRYHGWKYGPDGQCVEQPAEPEPFCQNIRIGSYPTQEYLGLVFAYFGEGDPPELPRYPVFEQEGMRLVTFYERACNYYNNLDNDSIHTYFTHYRTHLRGRCDFCGFSFHRGLVRSRNRSRYLILSISTFGFPVRFSRSLNASRPNCPY